MSDERRRVRAGAAVRRLAVDITPLRSSRDFRLLWLGQIVSITGRQITVVALPLQVYRMTGSPLAVGMIGLAQVVPLILFSVFGGPVADRVDRRRLIVVTEMGMAGTSAMLLLGAFMAHPPLAYLYAATGLQAGLSGINAPTRSAMVPNLVPRQQLPAALALNQILYNGGMILGPVVAGFLLALPNGFRWAYAADVASFLGSIGTALLMRPLAPKRREGQQAATGWPAVKEGFSFLRHQRVLVSTFLIDLDAMIFGMPRALFPILALTVFHVGPKGLGLLYAAPAAGAVAGALTTGWVGGVQRQGRAVITAVSIWGLAIAAFGLSGRLFPLALVFLALAGAADVISAVFRGTILQETVPDDLRGRLSAVHIMVVTGGPRLGDVEAGVVASLVSPWFSVVSGGVACVAGAALLALVVPELDRYRVSRATSPVLDSSEPTEPAV